MAMKKSKKGRRSTKKSDAAGAGTRNVSVISMVFTSVCCIGPLLLLALGLGSATLTAGLVKNKWIFMAMGAASLGASYYLYFRERKRCAAEGCTVASIKARKTFMGVATAVVVFFMVFSLYPYSGGSSNSAVGIKYRTASIGDLPNVFYFWEPCPTCTVTNPAVRKLEKKYKGQANFRWVNLVSDDDAYQLARKYDVQAIPWLVFADGDGSLKSLLKGWFSFDNAERQLKGVISNGVKIR